MSESTFSVSFLLGMYVCVLACVSVSLYACVHFMTFPFVCFRLELNMDLPSAQGAAIGSAASSQASQEQVSLVTSSHACMFFLVTSFWLHEVMHACVF